MHSPAVLLIEHNITGTVNYFELRYFKEILVHLQYLHCNASRDILRSYGTKSTIFGAYNKSDKEGLIFYDPKTETQTWT